jgi:hypothetical protein
VIGLGMGLAVMVGATIMRALLILATMCPLEQALTGDDVLRRQDLNDMRPVECRSRLDAKVRAVSDSRRWFEDVEDTLDEMVFRYRNR